MTAQDILKFLRRDFSGSAVVSEVVMDDPAYKLMNELHERDHKALGWHREGPCRKAVGASFRRIDALIFEGQMRTAVEIKVDRSDWLRENDDKRRPWRATCHRFVYACPRDLIRVEEVPPGCGLWYLDDIRGDGKYFKRFVAKKSVVAKDVADLPRQVWLAMAYRAAKAERQK